MKFWECTILSNFLWLFAYSVIWRYMDVLIYSTCPFSIKHLPCVLFLYYTDNLWFWAIFILVPLCCYCHLLILPLCVSFFFYCSFVLCKRYSSIVWCSDDYDKFSKMVCFAFSWCSTILLKSFIYLFIYLFITQGLVIAKASTTPLEPVSQMK
jgi:hypothetical protein